MGFFLLGLTLSLAAVNWVSIEKKWQAQERIAKPAVMVALLIWLWIASSFQGGTIWLGVALVFSLAGDVFLMLPKDKFILGVASFLLAHIAYITALNDPFTRPSIAVLGFAAALGLLGWLYLRHLTEKLMRGGLKVLTIPLLVYGTVLCLMAVSALLTLFRPDWNIRHAVLASLGGILFLISDGVLAWDRFVAPIPHGRMIVMVTYHLGQIGLVVGSALHFSAIA